MNFHLSTRLGGAVDKVIAVGGESMRGGTWVRDLGPVQFCSIFEGEFDDGPIPHVYNPDTIRDPDDPVTSKQRKTG